MPAHLKWANLLKNTNCPIQEEIGNMSNILSIKEFALVIKHIPPNKTKQLQAQVKFTIEFYQIFRKKRMPTLHMLFQKTEFPSFVPIWASMTLMPKSTNILEEKKITDQYPSNRIHQYFIKTIFIPWPSGIYPSNARMVYSLKSN